MPIGLMDNAVEASGARARCAGHSSKKKGSAELVWQYGWLLPWTGMVVIRSSEREGTGFAVGAFREVLVLRCLSQMAEANELVHRVGAEYCGSR